nr:AzlC family ABC transporter permease [uncultured Actinomyces sp.]
MPASPTRREILEGLRITAPVAAGYVPLGMAYGVLVVQLGMPWWMAPALSLSAYSGSAELLVVTLAAQNTPLAVIAVTMLLVNFRHLFYAFSFPLHVIEGRFARLFSMYALVDEAYALTAARPNGWTKPRLLAMQVVFNLTWVISGLIGVFAGSLIPTQIGGLDFALTALFITLTLDSARTRRELPSILLAGASFAVAMVVAPGQHLIVALLLFVACLSVRHLLHRLGIVSSPAPLHSGAREAGAHEAGASDTEVAARAAAEPEEAS